MYRALYPNLAKPNSKPCLHHKAKVPNQIRLFGRCSIQPIEQYQISYIHFYSSGSKKIVLVLVKYNRENVPVPVPVNPNLKVFLFVGGGSIGFLSAKERLNVALTRAKSALVLIGDLNTLQVIICKYATALI